MPVANGCCFREMAETEVGILMNHDMEVPTIYWQSIDKLNLAASAFRNSPVKLSWNPNFVHVYTGERNKNDCLN